MSKMVFHLYHILFKFFIADGYCNQRILKFNAAGHILRVIPQPPGNLLLF